MSDTRRITMRQLKDVLRLKLAACRTYKTFKNNDLHFLKTAFLRFFIKACFFDFLKITFFHFFIKFYKFFLRAHFFSLFSKNHFFRKSLKSCRKWSKVVEKSELIPPRPNSDFFFSVVFLIGTISDFT